MTTIDRRFPVRAPGVETVMLGPRTSTLNQLIESADAVWIVAPETDRVLERLAARVERRGKCLLGPGAAVIQRASNKAFLPRLLARCGIAHPETTIIGSHDTWRDFQGKRQLQFPIVVKAARGAGCDGVRMVRRPAEFARTIRDLRRSHGDGRLLLQQYVRGVAVSVSLLIAAGRAVTLAINGQRIRAGLRFSYEGGHTPLDHPQASRAIDAAVRACQALPGLKGYVGVDLILTRSDAIVVEINPRITTAYLGIRAALNDTRGQGPNLAALHLSACAGQLSTVPPLRRSVRFSPSGRILAVARRSSAA